MSNNVDTHGTNESLDQSGIPSAQDQRIAETVTAIRTEARAAYLDGVPDKHHPDL